MGRGLKKFILSSLVAGMALIGCGGGGGSSDNSDNGSDPSGSTYTVTYDANGAAGGVPADSTEYKSGDTVTVCGNTGNLTKTGYIFANWNSKPDGSGTSYFAGKFISIANADITLYAQWIDASMGNFTNIGTASSPVYSIITNGTPTGNIVIPSGYNGYPVTAIGAKAFYNCSGITSITIPNSVTSIGEYVFGSCIGITSITIPSSVKSIGHHAFYNCSRLTSITMKSTTPPSIGSSAFDLIGFSAVFHVPSGKVSDYNTAGYGAYGTVVTP